MRAGNQLCGWHRTAQHINYFSLRLGVFALMSGPVPAVLTLLPVALGFDAAQQQLETPLVKRQLLVAGQHIM